jgi:hypothetical protein
MKFRRDIPEPSGAKNFLKLQDKESVFGVFRGMPKEYFVIWGEDKRSREVPEGTPGAKFRFRINLFIKEGTVWVPKIFEQGLQVHMQLVELSDEYDLENTVVKITRNGKERDTTYSILPSQKQLLSKESAAFINSAELLNLDLGSKDTSKDSEDLPF